MPTLLSVIKASRVSNALPLMTVKPAGLFLMAVKASRVGATDLTVRPAPYLIQTCRRTELLAPWARTIPAQEPANGAPRLVSCDEVKMIGKRAVPFAISRPWLTFKPVPGANRKVVPGKMVRTALLTRLMVWL